MSKTDALRIRPAFFLCLFARRPGHAREVRFIMLSVRHLSVTHLRDLKELIHDLSFTVSGTDRLAVIGEEGNGKSTLLKLIYDAQSVQSYCSHTGEIACPGEAPGYLSQEIPPESRDLPVYAWCAEHPAFLDISPKELNRLCAQLQLPPDICYADQPVASLSGGEKVKLRLLLALCGLTAGILAGVFGARASMGFGRNLRTAMYQNIQTFSFSNIDRYSPSGLVTRLTTDVVNIQNAYQMILKMFVRAPFSMIAAMTAAFMINARIARIYLIAVICLAVFLFLIMGRTTKFFRMVFTKYDALNESVEENVASIRVVKAFVREDYEKTKFQTAVENIYRLFVKAENNMIIVMPVMMGTVYTVIMLISWTGAHMIVDSSLTTGELMSLLNYCMNILMSLMMLSMIFVMVTMSTASAQRIAEVISEKSDIVNPDNPVRVVSDGSIDFDDVDFAYRKDSQGMVLKDIDLHIRSGETIGIIGQGV